MMVMDYANNGNLHKHLQNNFTNVTWDDKLYILYKIFQHLEEEEQNKQTNII